MDSKQPACVLEEIKKKEIIIAEIKSIKDRIRNSTEYESILTKLCPHINLDKYSKSTVYHIDTTEEYRTTPENSTSNSNLSRASKDNPNSQDTPNNHIPKITRDNPKYPVYIAIIEEAILYACVMSRNALNEVVEAIRAEVPNHDLVYIHKIISNALVSSARYGYSDVYDRWLVLSAIKIVKISKKDEYIIEYFLAITERLKENKDGFRERGIILSDYLTQSELIHHSSESIHFCNDIPSRPIVEEDDNLSVEEIDEYIEITSLAEYYTTIKKDTFITQSSERVSKIISQLPSLILREPTRNTKKYASGIIEALISIESTEGTDAVCAILTVDDVAYDVFHMVYSRSRKSLYFRRILVACLINVSHRIRQDVSLMIINRYFSGSCEYSEEDRKLGIDTLKTHLILRNQ